MVHRGRLVSEWAVSSLTSARETDTWLGWSQVLGALIVLCLTAWGRPFEANTGSSAGRPGVAVLARAQAVFAQRDLRDQEFALPNAI
jgi:hypothetical protein